MDFVQCKTDPCVWKLVYETSQGSQLQVLVLFHIDDFMQGVRKGEVGWEEFQRRMHNKWKWSEWEQGHLGMTGVDVSQLQNGCFLMDQRAYVDIVEPADINPGRRKTPEAGTKTSPRYEDSGDRCNVHALRHMQRERVQCHCYNLHFQQQPLVR